MNNKMDITEDFGTLYCPKSALVFYECQGKGDGMYVEHFDIGSNGTPKNAHPLTVSEAKVLAKALDADKQRDKAFLKPNGILPTHVLHINPSGENGTVIWYTKARTQLLFFVDGLGIPSGKANIPPLLWYANKNSLAVFALTTDRRPTEKTPLHYAPFFNVYQDGKVCMGTVDVDIKKSASVEEFMQAWESYFFDSYFSHLMHEHNPVKGNCVSLWKKLIGTGEAFPKEALKRNNKTLKTLLR